MTNLNVNKPDELTAAGETVEEMFRTNLDVTSMDNAAILESMTEVTSGKIGLMDVSPVDMFAMDGRALGIHMPKTDLPDFCMTQLSKEEAIEFARAILKVVGDTHEVTEKGGC